MATVTIIGSGMMGSALAFPARENGHRVCLVGTPLDREIIEACKATGKHPKLPVPFPAGVEFYQIEELGDLLGDTDMVIGGVSCRSTRSSGSNSTSTKPERMVRCASSRERLVSAATTQSRRGEATVSVMGR